VRETRQWEKVLFLDDDGSLDAYKLRLDPVRKYFFYHRWNRHLPALFANIADYAEAFIAHDFVAVEYAIMRKFGSEGKPIRLFEEGFGNYIDNSTHTRWDMKLLKRLAPSVGLPGAVFGSVKWIDSIWLQRPQLFLQGSRSALKRKARPLPMTLKQFFEVPAVADELYGMYPELGGIDRLVSDREAMTVVLTEPFLDDIADRDACLRQIVAKVRETLGDSGEPLFVKQHPGEMRPIGPLSGRVRVLPRSWPIELLYLVMLKNRIRKLNLFSFGSTAILNLYDLCRSGGNLDIFIFESMDIQEEEKLLSSRFRELASRYEIAFQTL